MKYNYYEDENINVRNFIVENYTPYDGDESFLVKPTTKTKKLWNELKELLQVERERGGIYAIDSKTISTIDSHAPGYINKKLETIVGLQTDEPLKRAIMPFGGIRLVAKEMQENNLEMDSEVANVFKYRKTHNDGVFDVYSSAMRGARHSHIITGLPDAYGRGRIIGDYRRVALYGVDYLIEQKQKSLKESEKKNFTEEVIREREEVSEQIRALKALKRMAESYGIDISKPATNTKEAIQWVYFGYLGAVKEQNGAAMSIGRISTFLDIYAEKDLKDGTFTEDQIQEFVDHFIMKLRIVRFLRTAEYDRLFSGDPTWVTESIGGIGLDGRHMVTKMSYRFLHTLTNLGPAPEPNMTILWSQKLPENFKKYCAKTSILTSSIQYENDDLMRVRFGDDYGIACCVSAMRIGKQMQFFGARANLAKALLYAINGGYDEVEKDKVFDGIEPIKDEVLPYKKVVKNYDKVLDILANLYINTLNAIHYMHDKYCYEAIEMALHDNEVVRTMAGGIAGLSVVTDSLSAIKYAKVKPIRDENGIAVDFEIEGDFPKYGNNDNRVDSIAVKLVDTFIKKLRKQYTYRKSVQTLSVLTITSNVVYGKHTGTTPDGRKHGEPFAPGANPMHGRDKNGCIASLKSVAKLDYDSAEDGISNTFSIIPNSLGKTDANKVENLVGLLDGYFGDKGHHLNVNVLNIDTLRDAMDHPEKYPQLTIRVSGYAVNFIKLTREQQEDVISRTFHEKF